MEDYRETFLDKHDDRNKTWYEIYDESASLIVELDKIHRKLGELKPTRIFPFRLKRDFQLIKNETDNIYPKFNNWLNKAKDFTESPHMAVTARIDREIDSAVGYLHYSSVIQNRIATLEMMMNGFQRDLYQVWLLLKHQESTFVAIVFFSVGIIIALIGILLQYDFSELIKNLSLLIVIS